MNRNFDIPDFFKVEKNDLEKKVRAFFYSRRDEKGERIETKENLGLLYLHIKSYLAFVETIHNTIGTELLAAFDKEGVNEVIFENFDKKIFFDPEGNWLFESSLTPEDHLAITERDNTDYLKRIEENSRKL